MTSQELLGKLALHHDTFILSATGRSMAPAIVRGDKLHFARGLPLAPGDVALCRGPGSRLLIHRVISLDPFRTRGDALSQDDEAGGQPLAKLVRIERTWLSRLRRFGRRLRGL